MGHSENGSQGFYLHTQLYVLLTSPFKQKTQ